MGKLGVPGVWDIERRVRLEELVEKVAGDGGATPAQVGVLYVALAAEFQGYCRDLHQECIDDLLDQMALVPFALKNVVGVTLRNGRALDRQNATTEAVAKDFKDLGISPWEIVQRYNKDEYHVWREGLDLVNSIRDAVAHSNEMKIDQYLERDELTMAKWTTCLDCVARLAVALHGAAEARLRGMTLEHINEGG